MPAWYDGITYTQDPDDTLDYPFDWSDWLETGDTISSVSVTVSSGMTMGTVTFTTTAVIAWVSGGAVGEVYTLSCRVTTSGGRTKDRTIRIKVKEE